MPAVLMKLNDAIVKQKIRIIIFFSSILFYFPSRWHCIVLCWVLHLSSIELQQPQRRSLFNIRRQHQATINDATQGRNYGNGLEAFIRDGRCALVIPPGPHGYERVLHNCLNDFKSIVWEILFLFLCSWHRAENCITYESVDRAFHTARQHINGPYPKGRSMTDLDVDTLGHVIVETSRILAKEWVTYTL